VTRRSEAELVALLLTQRLVEAAVPPLRTREFWSLVATVEDLGALLGLESPGIAAMAGIEGGLAARVAVRLEAATAFASALDDVEQRGLCVVAGTSEAYPAMLRARLQAVAPPLLYLLGPAELLDVPALGVVGSRQVTVAGASIAHAAARAAVEHGFALVSGGARGVDRIAIDGALDAGGTVVAVLADSLYRAAREPDTRRAISAGALCLCSPYPPSAGFTAANALGRNKLIYALSAATLVVECRPDTGGSWAGAVEALRYRTTPVVVWTGEGATDGNWALASLGARAVEDVGQLFPLPAHREDRRVGDQLVLDV
jgi:predicted Rossmann fold nucleotide-binding protein DprA/Smf involved in DNA uptake